MEKVNLYYTNFVQAKIKLNNEWKKCLLYHEWGLTYDGEAFKLDNMNEDDIIELDWRNLSDE